MRGRSLPEDLCGLQETEQHLAGGRLPYAQDQRYTGPVGKATVHIYDGPDAGLLASSGRAKGMPQDGFFHIVQVYQFKVMPFGLQEAPATFQKLMDHVIREMNGFASAYLDDLIIYSNSWADHVSHLRRVLDRLVGAEHTLWVVITLLLISVGSYSLGKYGTPRSRSVLSSHQAGHGDVPSISPGPEDPRGDGPLITGMAKQAVGK